MRRFAAVLSLLSALALSAQASTPPSKTQGRSASAAKLSQAAKPPSASKTPAKTPAKSTQKTATKTPGNGGKPATKSTGKPTGKTTPAQAKGKAGSGKGYTKTAQHGKPGAAKGKQPQTRTAAHKPAAGAKAKLAAKSAPPKLAAKSTPPKLAATTRTPARSHGSRWSAQPGPHNGSLLAQLTALAPDADPGVLALAVEARACAQAAGMGGRGHTLAVIDYSRPSSVKRLWVFDIRQQTLLHHEHVTHGSGSGENFATRFSNTPGSHQTSLGLYRTAETYEGANGYSLRLDGLDEGFNDAARERAIVIHGANYADPELISKNGRLGRSQGCPALHHGVAQQVIDALKEDQLVFAYADDADWLRSSRHFGCQSGQSARHIMAQARAAHGRPLQVASRR